MKDKEKQMRALELESLRLDCAKIRLETRPWFKQTNSMLCLMKNMGQKMQDHTDFPDEIKPANLKTLNDIKRELAYRN